MLDNFLPVGWVEVSLDNLVGPNGVFSDGDWVESKDQDPSGKVRLTQLADIGEMQFLDKSNRFMTLEKAKKMNCLYLQKDDLLISRLGDPLGKSCLYPATGNKAVTVVDVSVFRPGHTLIENKLIGYFLNSPKIRRIINDQSSGTTRKRITGKKLKSLLLPLPPLNEQKRILDKIEQLFSNIDEGESLLKQVQQQLNIYRQSVLKAAVTGELTKDWREANRNRLEPADVLLNRIQKARREQSNGRGQYKEPMAPNTAGLPELPDGWVWASTDQLFDVYGGSTPSRKQSEYWNGDIPWVSSGEVAFCRIKDTKEKISKVGFDNSSVKLHPKGTVLVAMIGEGKTRGQAAILDIEACHNQNSASIRVSETEISPDYIYYNLLHNYEKNRSVGQGGNQPALNGQKVKQFVIPLPSVDEQKEIVDKIDDVFSQIDTLEQWCASELTRSTTLRQSLLKDAFSGKLVPQDPSDEPASELLKRIQAERSDVIKVPKQKSPAISSSRRGRKIKKS